MALLKIYKLDDHEETLQISIFSEGKHVIGRENLNYDDKSVSRNHALIIITEGTVKIKSTDVNPTYYTPYGENSIQVIKNNSTIKINDGDTFSLLPSKFWFRIRVAKNQEIPESNKCPKRINEEELSKEISKTPKISEVTTNVSSNSEDYADSLIHDNSNNRNQKDVSISKENLDLDNLTEEKCIKDSNDINEATAILQGKKNSGTLDSKELKKQNEKEDTTDMPGNETNLSSCFTKNDDDTSNKDNASTSKTKTTSDRCWYSDSSENDYYYSDESFNDASSDDFETSEEEEIHNYFDTSEEEKSYDYFGIVEEEENYDSWDL